MITGGEPLLFPEKLANLAESIKTVQKLAYGNKGKLFLYTALADMLPIISDTSMELFTLHILLMMFIVYWRPIIFCWITKMNLWKVNLFGSIFFLILKSIFLTTQTFRYPYRWSLEDAVFTKDKGKVFSCFACGGGSTMGYKIAGYDVIGCNEIDPRMMKCYETNHHPQYSYLEDIRDLVKRNNLPEELYHLDILDGSPPCSTFSMSGLREDAWGKEKKFKEGQKTQVLDTLFFDFIALAKRLKPKVVIAENVKGLLLGNAIDYVRRIYKDFEEAGYYCQHFLLDASKMGVPQKRERVFFICIRHDLGVHFLKVSDLFNVEPYIDMEFNESEIYYGEYADYKGKPIGVKMRKLFEQRVAGDIALAEAYKKQTGKRGFFNQQYLYENKVSYTLTTHADSIIPFKQPIYLSRSEVCNISTFPQDYHFLNQSPHYICGMSVPPVMMAHVASRIWKYWLSKL